MNSGLLYSIKVRVAICILLAGSSLVAYCQADDTYEDISITFNVQRIGSCEIPAIINGESVYLPIKEVFDFLRLSAG